MKTNLSPLAAWFIEQHELTNHYYDDNLPYSYHLCLTRNSANKYKHLVPKEDWPRVSDGLFGHDGIEDARLSYNDVYKAALRFGHTEANARLMAEEIRAVTNIGRGRDRDERMPDFVYKEIFETGQATFYKLMDRLANVKHGLISGGTMRKRYLKEQPHFKSMLYKPEHDEIWNDLDKLLNLDDL